MWEETTTYGYVNMNADYIAKASRDPTAPRQMRFSPEIVYPSQKAAADAVATANAAKRKEEQPDPTAIFQMRVAFSGHGMHAHTFVNPRRNPRKECCTENTTVIYKTTRKDGQKGPEIFSLSLQEASANAIIMSGCGECEFHVVKAVCSEFTPVADA